MPSRNMNVDGRKWFRSEDWVGSDVADSFVILNFNSGEYVALNSTAAAIWNILETPASNSDIVATLTARYRIDPDHCVKSVQTLLDQLAGKGLVEQGT